jgi:membrane-associated phospholipid phosphatase
MNNKKHYDFTSALDKKVPFVKEWIIIYVVCYLFWIINYILSAREGKEKCFRFAFADLTSRLICGIFFILLPTTNIRPVVEGNDFFSWLMRFIYHADSPTNLFPSIHCLVSWFCFIGIRKSDKIPPWYKVFSFVFALLVCASTQFTKQHYLIDVAGGILIAELCYFFACHTQYYQGMMKLFGWLDQRIDGVINHDE